MKSENKIKVTGKDIALKLGIDVSTYETPYPQYGHGTIPPQELFSENSNYEFNEEEYKNLVADKKTGKIYDAGYSTDNIHLGKSGKKEFSIVIGGDTSRQGQLEIE